MSQDEQGQTQKICFVIMPISDVAGYEAGHFGRVYEHLLRPAIVEAGFLPVRADDEVKTDYIAVEIVKRIIESEMVLCDFSSRNPNVMYELGLRHAYNKKVVLVRDSKTDRIFDIQGLRTYDYDINLRVDSVQKDREEIKKAILMTANAQDSSVNSIVQLAGVHAAPVPTGQQVSGDTKLILESIRLLNSRLSMIEDKVKPNVTSVITNADSLTSTIERFFLDPTESNFMMFGEGVLFKDGTVAHLGDDVFLKGKKLGRLVQISSGGSIVVAKDDGQTASFVGRSFESKGLSAENPLSRLFPKGK